MKLLNKNQINSIKASERKNEIDQGLRLAKKVDELRVLSSKEEDKLMKFKTETVKIVQKEVDNLILKKENLEYEVSILEHQNTNLKKPFDEEWEMIRMKRLSDLDDKLKDLEQRERKIVKDEQKFESDFKLRNEKLKLDESRVSDQISHSEIVLENALKKEELARSIFNESNLRQAEVNSEIDAKMNNLKKIEAESLAKEKDLDMREEAFKRSVKELARRERFINDKYATLMRTEKSLKINK